ncbi:hemerythrin domain-containing protein [Sphingomonas sp. QA11]|uniref:hemerythrin domain-containing protein n=1 Tax=Sphingomonas sp. QA11 TaxID=2950605 RepID=UPI00234A9AD0|nr:hemerythrin domain-containing protein [Sphingomonas sp. QA11]WCM28352.1 hemerythrin domain-containing protein [Sphingomonas sp. QA11]
MPIAKLECEHRRILELAGSLEAIVAGPRPETHGLLMRSRWNFTREVLSHLSNDDALLLVPLMGDRRPHIAQLATQSRAQLRTLHDDLENHMDRWKGLPATTEWSSYRREVQALIRRLRARIAAEESGIHHFLPVQRADPRPVLPTDCPGDATRAV